MRFGVFCSAVMACGAAVAGTITGTVNFEGNAPEMRPLQMSGNAECSAMHDGEPPKNETLVLGEKNEMANVLVRVIEGLPDKTYPPPEEPVVVTQKGCVYSPHVFAVQAGQPLKVLNPDDVFHNVNGNPRKNEPFNLAMSADTKELEIVFETPEEPFPFLCHVHPWMRAYCAVLEHPFFDVTGKDGTYKIENLPPGEYTIEVWHERLRTQTAKVTVPEAGEAEQDFTYEYRRR